jgi:hypothetical protein
MVLARDGWINAIAAEGAISTASICLRDAHNAAAIHLYFVATT